MNNLSYGPFRLPESEDAPLFPFSGMRREKEDHPNAALDAEIAKVRGVFEGERMQHPGDTRVVCIDLNDNIVPFNERFALNYDVPAELMATPGLTGRHLRFLSILYKNLQDPQFRVFLETPDLTWGQVRDRLLANRGALDVLARSRLHSFMPRFRDPETGAVRFDQMDILEKRTDPTMSSWARAQDLPSIVEAQAFIETNTITPQPMEPAVFLGLVSRGKAFEAERRRQHPEEDWGGASFHRTIAHWLAPDSSPAGRAAAANGFPDTLGSHGTIRHVNRKKPAFKDAFPTLYSFWV